MYITDVKLQLSKFRLLNVNQVIVNLETAATIIDSGYINFIIEDKFNNEQPIFKVGTFYEIQIFIDKTQIESLKQYNEN